MEHPLNPHKSYAYSPPSPAVPHRKGFRQGSVSHAYHAHLSPRADAPPYAADRRRAGPVPRVPEASSNLNSFLR